jgi:chromosomal replication initiation ATPase DnaA
MLSGYTMTDVSNFIADAENEVGRMMGALVKLEIRFRPKISELMDEMLASNTSKLDDKVNEIINLVGIVLDEHPDDIKSKSRKHEHVECRYIAMRIIYDNYYPHLSYRAIGSYFSNRDHSTVYSAAIYTFQDLYETDKTFKGKYENCTDEYKKLINKQQQNDESIQNSENATTPESDRVEATVN